MINLITNEQLLKIIPVIGKNRADFISDRIINNFAPIYGIKDKVY